jgi:hypothetical protein
VPLNLSLYPVILYNKCYTWFQKSLDFGANLWIRMVRFLDSAPTLPRIRQKLGGKLDLAGFDFFPWADLLKAVLSLPHRQGGFADLRVAHFVVVPYHHEYSTPHRQKNTARIHLIDLHVPPRLKLYGCRLSSLDHVARSELSK